MNIYSSLYLILIVFFLFFLYRNQSFIRLTGAYAGIVFSFFLYFAIIPFLFLTFENVFQNSNQYIRHSKHIFEKGGYEHLFAFMLIIVGFLAFHFSYVISLKNKFKIMNVKYKKSGEKRKLSFDKVLLIFQRMGYFTFLIGSISFIYIIIAAGGISNVLAIGEHFRGFDSETSLASFIGSTAALFLIPARFITVSPLLFFFLMMNRKKKMDGTMFLISFSMATLFFLFNAGRAPLIIFLLVYIYIYTEKRVKNVWLFILILGVICLPLLDLMDLVFVFLATGIWGTIDVNYVSYLEQFIHPFRNLLNINNFISINDFQFGMSIIKEILGVLPKVGFEPLYYNISLYFNGFGWKSGIPTDIITYGYYQLGVIGVIILLSGFGFFCGILDRKIKYLPENRSRKFISVALATSVFGFVSYLDFSSILKSNFTFIIVCMILALITQDNLINKKTSSIKK